METHYAYRVDEINGRDIAMDTYDLSMSGPYARRTLIGNLLKQGRFLSKLPPQFVMERAHFNLFELTDFINGDFD